MRPDGVVVVSPLLDDDLGFLDAVEDFPVEQLVSEFAVEGLTVPVLPGATWLDVKGFGADIGQPLPHNLRSHLRTVVGADVFGNAMYDHGVGHRLNDTQTVDPPGDADG